MGVKKVGEKYRGEVCDNEVAGTKLGAARSPAAEGR